MLSIDDKIKSIAAIGKNRRRHIHLDASFPQSLNPLLNPTVGKLESLAIWQVKPEDLDEFLSWIHNDLSPEELSLVRQEVAHRQRFVLPPPPLIAAIGSDRIAGVYFTCLPGRLAMLGAVRAAPNNDSIGSYLLKTQVDQLGRDLGIVQIQAAVSDGDMAACGMLETAGFHRLTAVQQMWLSINSGKAEVGCAASEQPLEKPADFIELQATPPTLVWTSTGPLGIDQFTDLLLSTFEDTLDCPELNGLRSGREVLESFLLGAAYDEMDLWEIAWLNGRPAGCLLMTQHPNSVVEIAYMGLISAARFCGLGTSLVQRACEQAKRIGATTLVLAVDERNEPALKTYVRNGFQRHRRLQVYLMPRDH
jgi:GNAT superfamily N-acetyltransferase